uniref:Uncharacterized protein n=1 Tax=Rhizophora mucronata TaxID=61149 RepID=A0A2P2QNT6_RHIMU
MFILQFVYFNEHLLVAVEFKMKGQTWQVI